MIPLIIQHHQALTDLCARFRVARLEVFGSASDGTFDPQRSDLDFLVEFHREGGNLFHRYFNLHDELERLFARRVDLVMAGAMKNPFFIAAVNRSRRLLYAA